jgi:hypothetical protein
MYVNAFQALGHAVFDAVRCHFGDDEAAMCVSVGPLYQAIERSRASRYLESIIYLGRVHYVSGEHNLIGEASEKIIKKAQNLALMPHMVSRAYAQAMFCMIGELEVSEKLSAARAAFIDQFELYRLHDEIRTFQAVWDAEDFDPILDSFRGLIQALGWN